MSKLGTIQDVLDYLAESRHTIHYTGWIGYRNLGDEILLEAARESFAPARVVWIKAFHNGWVRKLVERQRHELAMLGGGTQIGEHSPIERFKQALTRCRGGIVFGAGVTPAQDGPVPDWLQRWGEVLRPLEYVGTRGPESANTLQRVGVNAQVLGDPVCWFSRPLDHWRPEAGLVGINVGTSHGHVYGDESVIRQQFVRMVRQLLAEGNRIEFFCVWPEDLESTRRVAAEAGIVRPVIHEVYEGAAAYQEKVRRMQVFVGIKLHACALAMCANVPTLVVEYRPKCREYAGTMGVEEFCVRSDGMDVDQMLSLVATLRARGPEISERLHRSGQVIRDRILALAAGLRRRHGWG